MAGLAGFVGFEPFLEAAFGVDLVRGDTGTHLNKLFAKVFIQAENFCGFDGIAEEFTELLEINGRASTDATLTFSVR